MTYKCISLILQSSSSLLWPRLPALPVRHLWMEHDTWWMFSSLVAVWKQALCRNNILSVLFIPLWLRHMVAVRNKVMGKSSFAVILLSTNHISKLKKKWLVYSFFCSLLWSHNVSWLKQRKRFTLFFPVTFVKHRHHCDSGLATTKMSTLMCCIV